MTTSDRIGPLGKDKRRWIALASLMAALIMLTLLASPGHGVRGDAPGSGGTPEGPELSEHEVFLNIGDIGQFSRGPSVAAQSVEADGTVVLFAEGFEGAWPPPGAVAQAPWGPSTCRAFSGLRSAWVEGSASLACGSSYYNDQSSFLVFGPFDLADATTGSFSNKMWLNSETGYDYLCRLASLDGLNFGGVCTSGRSNGWIPRALDLNAVPGWGNVAGTSAVWVALGWITDSSVTRTEGAFVDDLRLDKALVGPTMTPPPTRAPAGTPTQTPTPFPPPSWQWQTEKVADVLMSTYISSLALDTSGRPWIGFYGRSFSLELARWDGSTWRTEQVDTESFTGEYSSLKLDGANRPHIAYYTDLAAQDLKYASWDGTAWHIETVDSAGDVGSGTSLALDSAGNPHISYLSAFDSRMKYAYWDGSAWHIEAVDSVDWSDKATSLILDTAGRAHISYCGSAGLKHTWWDGAAWHTEVVDSGSSMGSYSSLVLDASGCPHIGYYDGTNTALKYAYWDGSTWHTETVDNDGDVGMYASLALDNAGQPHLAYYLRIDSSHGALKYAHWDGAAWHTGMVEGGDVGNGSSLALNAAGLPRISYYDGTISALRFAQWRSIPPTATPTPVTPTPVVPPGQAQSYAPELAPAAGGGAVVVWHDDRFGSSYNYDVFARRFGADGSAVWPADVRVSAGPGTARYEEKPSVATNVAGESIIAWQSNGSVLAQALDAAGNRLWITDTVILGPPVDNGYNARVAVDQSSNWYVLWERYFDECNNDGSCDELCVTKFGAGGWSTSARSLIYQGAYWPDIAVDAAGNSRVVWQEGYTSQDWPVENSQIYALALNSTGAQLGLNAMRVNSDSRLNPRGHARVAAGFAGDTYFVWADMRDGHWDIYAQRFDAEVFYRVWANDVLVNGDGSIANQVEPDLVATAGGYIYVTWVDDRDRVHNIYAQKLAQDGSRVWPQDVCVNAGTAADERSNPAITVDAGGIVYIAWESSLGSQHDIFMQSLTADGSRRWTNDVTVEGSPVTPTRTPTRNPAHTAAATRTRMPTLAPTATPTPTRTYTPVPGAPTRTASPTATVTRTPGPASVFTWAATGLTETIYSLALSPAYASDSTLFAGGDGRVWRSTTGGTAWTFSVPATGTVSVLAVSPSLAVDHTVFAVLYGRGLYKSTNSGDGWTRVSSNSEIQAVALSPNYANDQTVFFGTTTQWDSGVYRSNDGGGTWTGSGTGLKNVYVYSLAISPNYAQDRTLFAGIEGYVFRSTDGGDSWTKQFGGYPQLLGAVWPMCISPGHASDGVVFALPGADFWRRSSGGGWSYRGQVAIDPVMACAVSPRYTTDRTLFAGTDGSGVLFSHDEGDTWQTIPVGLESFNINALAVAFAPLQTVFAGTTRGVWKSIAASPPTPTPTLTSTATPIASATPTATCTLTASPTPAGRLYLPVLLRKR